MRPRFHVPAFDAAAARVALPAEEAAHLVRVLRLGAGAQVEVIDGQGGAWEAEVVDAGKRGAAVRAVGPVAPALESRVPITLLIAVLKGDKMDDVVRDAVMLGAAAVRPLVTSRTETSAAALARGRRTERWQRVAVSSVKQCGRAVVPTVGEPVAFERYLAEKAGAARLMCVEPGAGVVAVSARDVAAPASADLLVGPEGGWTPEEVAAARAAGVTLISLGARTLRADAVPLVAMTALMTAWSDL